MPINNEWIDVPSSPAAAGGWVEVPGPHERYEQWVQDTLGPAGTAFNDASTGAGAGALWGAKDELLAGMATPFRVGYNAVTGADEGKGLVPRFADAFNTELDTQRGIERRARARSPVATGVGEAVGAGASFVGSLGKASAPATSLWGAIKQNAKHGLKQGTAFGLVHGFNTGEGGFANRAVNAAVGGSIGAVAGGGLPFVLQPAARLASPLVRPVVSRIRGAIDPDKEASKRVAQAVDTDQNLGEGLTEKQFAAAQQLGSPVANIDRGGETARAVARSAANTSPEARSVLNRTINERFEGQYDRVQQWFRRHTKASDDVSGTRDVLIEKARAANRPAYKAAYAAGDVPLASDELNRLAGSDIVATSIQRVVQGRGRDRAIAEGYGAFNPAFTITKDGRVVRNPYSNGKGLNYPNLQFWDYVKREADSLVKQAQRSGADVNADAQIVRQLRDELDRLVPDKYQQARQGAASWFGAEDALTAGQNFARMSRPDIKAARRQITAMNDAERELFEDGYVSTIMADIGKVRDRQNIVPKIWGSPQVRDQMRAVLGPRRARQFEAFTYIETAMDFARGAVQGNSTTVRQLVEAGIAGTGVGLTTGDPVSGVATALAWRGARGAGNAVDAKVARKVAEMLMSSDPAILQRGVRIVAKNAQMMASLRAFTTAMGSVVAVQQGP